MKKQKHFNIKITGLVQGVFFRTSAKENADELKITGFARNQPDKSVYIEAEGGEDDLNRFLAWCHEGPDSAKVGNIEISDGTIQNFSEFRIL